MEAAMNRKRLIGLLCFLASTGLASADEPQSSPRMDVDEVVAAALRDNPRLAGMRAEWSAMQELPAQEGSLPNPVVTYKGMDSTDRFPGTDEQRYEAEQTIPWPGKRGLKSRLAGKDAETTGLEYEIMRRETALMARESCYELIAVRRSIEIVQSEEDVLKQMVQVAETKYSTGEVSQQDMIKAQSEIPMLRGKLLELQAREASLTARLNTLLNRPAAAPLDVTAEPPPSLPSDGIEALLAAGETGRPEIRAAQIMIERGTTRQSLMRREYLPDFMVGLEYRQLPEEDDMAMFMVGLEIPFWIGKTRAGIRESGHQIAAGQAALESAKRETQNEIHDAWYRAQAARQTLDLYEKELLPQAEQRFTASEAGYRAGQVDFMELLESERFLLNARLMRAMAEGDAGMRQARLDWAAGMSEK